MKISHAKRPWPKPQARPLRSNALPTGDRFRGGHAASGRSSLPCGDLRVFNPRGLRPVGNSHQSDRRPDRAQRAVTLRVQPELAPTFMGPASKKRVGHEAALSADYGDGHGTDMVHSGKFIVSSHASVRRCVVVGTKQPSAKRLQANHQFNGGLG